MKCNVRCKSALKRKRLFLYCLFIGFSHNVTNNCEDTCLAFTRLHKYEPRPVVLGDEKVSKCEGDDTDLIHRRDLAVS